MDKFVIKTPRHSPVNSPAKRKDKYMKQATIESLSGVVVIEELERAKIILENADTSEELKKDTLQSLMRKNPAKEILLKTGVGKTVHKLCKHKNEGVAAEAKKVYSKWKANILSKVNRPLMEVECDLKTKNFRRTARQMLLGAMRTKKEGGGGDKEKKQEIKEKKEGSGNSSKNEGDIVLAEFIERELYRVTNRRCNNSYRRTIRKLVFTLRHKHELRAAVLDASVSVPDFVKEYLQE